MLRCFSRFAWLLVLTAALPLPVAAKTIDIGVAAAVRPQATGTPPEQDSRILNVGIDLFANERIETGPSGQTHLLFRDGSSISIGPRATLVLDSFVYDPETKTGELVVSASKGLFRFVGGRISKTKPVLFKTPEAVIGIRGGVAMMNVNTPADIQAAQQQGQNLNPADVTMLYGDEVFMDTGSTRQTMNRPGSTMSLTPGGVITPPTVATQQQLNAALSSLEEPQQSEDDEGGLGSIAPAAGGPAVSDSDVSNSQLSELGSNNAPAAVGGSTPPPPAPLSAGAAETATATASQQQMLDASVPNRPVGELMDSDGLSNLVTEGAPVGQLVGIMAMALDPDSTDTVTFVLIDNAGGRFAIDPVTGKVSVASSELLDFESAMEHQIIIQAMSTDGSTLTLPLTIALGDDTSEFTVVSVLDNNAAANEVSEEAANGAIVGIMAFANDDDASDSVTYSLVNDANGRFTIDPNTGTVTVADASLIDFEASSSHTVTVRATSTDNSFSDQEFTIAVLEVESESGGGATLPAFVGRARCCEDNGTGTDDGNGSRDFNIGDVNIAGTTFAATGANGNFGDLFFPSSDGAFGSGAATGALFDPGFGVPSGGFVTRALNGEFAFYELSSASGQRGIILAGVPTPQSTIPTSGFTRYKIFDDTTNTDAPNVSRVPFVRHAISGMEDNTDAYFVWNDNGSNGQKGFGIGRVLISGPAGTGQNASVSVVVGEIAESGDGNTYLDGWQRGSQRAGFGNPRQFDGRVASLPLNSSTSTDSHFVGSNFPGGFHLAAATANGGLEPGFTGTTRRHGAPNNDFTDRPNAVGLLEDHSATTANARTTGNQRGFMGGVLAFYLPTSTSTSPNGFRPFISSNETPSVVPPSFLQTSASLNQIEFQLEARVYDNAEPQNTLVTRFGGFNNNAASLFVDDQIFVARENFNSPGTTNGGNNLISAATSRFYLTTAHNFEHNAFQGSTTFCTCSFLTWGFLGFDFVDTQDNNIKRSQLATWVTGNNHSRQLSQFPNGTATYSGHVFGTVATGPTVYAATGNLEMNLSFSSGLVTVTSGSITNFDGGNYTMSNVGETASFGVTANLTLTTKTGYQANDIQGRMAGMFYGTGAPPENFAGNFRLEKAAGSGADYDAGGIAMAETAVGP